MIKISKFEVTELEKIHVSDEWHDNEGKLLRTRNYTNSDLTDTHCTYNEKGLLLSEKSFQDDTELEETRYAYDNDDNVVTQEYFISGELYERTVNIYSPGKFESFMEQDGEEIERSIRIEDGDNHVTKFFENGGIVEKQAYIFNPETNIGEKRFYDAQENLFITEIIEVDRNDNITEFKQLNAEGQLLEYEKHHYQGSLLMESIFKTYKESENEYKVIYTYNQEGEVLREEVKTLEDNLLGFNQFRYDDENRLVEEMEFYHAKYNAIYGTYANGKNTRFRFEYEEEKVELSE